MQRYQNSVQHFICPVCKHPLLLRGNSLVCKKKHCYDIARQGYVNLVPHARQPKNYDKQSFENRRMILARGLYSHVLAGLLATLEGLDGVKTVLDAGCGEGYYARAIGEQTNKQVLAFDLSKDSVQLAAKNDREGAVQWFVGDLTNLPLKQKSVDCVLNIFSPANYGEFRRVLANKGYLIKIIPGNNHLKEFREAAREQLQSKDYANQQTIDYLQQTFTLTERRTVTACHALTGEERDIFARMTPLFFHVDRDRVDLSGVEGLTIEAEILVGTSRGTKSPLPQREKPAKAR